QLAAVLRTKALWHLHCYSLAVSTVEEQESRPTSGSFIRVNDQIVAKKRELELIQQELKGVHELWQKNLVPITRVTSLEQHAARLEGERGSLVSTVAQAKGKITETELQIIQIDQDMRTEIGKELADIRGKTSELMEKKVAAEDQLKRVDIRAPQDGS